MVSFEFQVSENRERLLMKREDLLPLISLPEENVIVVREHC